MFKLPAVLFALIMGFLMSMTQTFCISLYLLNFSSQFVEKWFQLWPIAYPIAVISIYLYRPFVIKLIEFIIKKLNKVN